MRRDLTDLTDLHLLILGVLWTAGEATIARIHATIGQRHDVSQKTIGTLLGRLEKRNLVSHSTVGREGVYRPLVTRRQVLVSRVGGALASVFAAEDDAVGSAAVRKKHVRSDAARYLTASRDSARDLNALIIALRDATLGLASPVAGAEAARRIVTISR